MKHTRHAHEKRSGGVAGRPSRERYEKYARRLVDRESKRHMLRHTSAASARDLDGEARRTHRVVGREKVDEFADGERDGHGDRGGDEEETYGEEERLSLGLCEGDDFAEG